MEKSVLFVDDDTQLLEFLGNAIRVTEFKGFTAESGKQALAILDQHDIQVAVVDQSMPEMPGTELLRELKISAPDIVRIIMTGYDDLQFAIDAINEGEVFRFLRKPFNVDQLIGILSEAFEEYQRNKNHHHIIKRLETLQDQPEDGHEEEMSQTAFFHLDKTNGRILHVNSAAEELTNLPRDQLLQSRISEVLKEIDYGAFWKEIQHGLEDYGIALTQLKLHPGEESLHYDITAILSPGEPGGGGEERVIMVFSPQYQMTSAELNLYNYVIDLETNYALKDRGLKFLYEMSKKVGTTQNFDELVQTIFSDLKKIIDFDIGMLATFQERETDAYVISDYILNESILSMLKAEIHGQYLTRSPAQLPKISPDIQIKNWDGEHGDHSEHASVMPTDGIKANINLPLKAPEEQLVGMVYIGSCQKSSYSGEEVRLLYTFAARIALVLHIINNLFAFRQVKEMAIKDSLTGLYNRRFFEEEMKKELTRAQRYHSSVSFLILDIDHFKQVNDTYGHLKGDEILKELAQIISHSARSSDIPVRYGGEEFVIILPETSLDGALVIAERLRDRVENHPFRLSDDGNTDPEEISITISIGISNASASKMVTSDELVAQGDKALYHAKKNGRNRVVTYDSLEPAVS
ncbi:MAG TPA: diguanylate cyclase [bacterium]|nr:diguanylate cyclase [bacterium]